MTPYLDDIAFWKIPATLTGDFHDFPQYLKQMPKGFVIIIAKYLILFLISIHFSFS
jgi:hypothetical protein